MKIYSKLWFLSLGPDPHPVAISRSPLVVRNSLPSRRLPQEKVVHVLPPNWQVVSEGCKITSEIQLGKANGQNFTWVGMKFILLPFGADEESGAGGLDRPHQAQNERSEIRSVLYIGWRTDSHPSGNLCSRTRSCSCHCLTCASSLNATTDSCTK